MEDRDIIKALECCDYPTDDLCCECCFKGTGDCTGNLTKATIDLINRQKKELQEKSRRLKGILPIVAELKENTVKEFEKFLIDKAENGVISVADLPSYVIDFQKVGSDNG